MMVIVQEGSYSNVLQTTVTHTKQNKKKATTKKMVDFIDLANGHRQLLQRLLDGGDDDFAKMENEYSYSSSSGIRNDNPSSSSMTSQQQSYGSEATAPAPLLSKSAEAELYLLATNFLLCTLCVCVFRFETF